MSAKTILDREFLEMRAKVLELAASLDRMDRGAGSVAGDPRMNLIAQCLVVLQSDKANRAERIQLIFSRAYDPNWRQELGVAQH
jgi:hypothetical protein